MSTFSTRVLAIVTLQSGDVMDLSLAVDIGEHNKLDVVVHVSTPGEGESPILHLEHAASNEEGAYVPFETPMEVDLSTEGRSWFHADRFTRWLTWRLSGTLTSGAVVTLDLVARR